MGNPSDPLRTTHSPASLLRLPALIIQSMPRLVAHTLMYCLFLFLYRSEYLNLLRKFFHSILGLGFQQSNIARFLSLLKKQTMILLCQYLCSKMLLIQHVIPLLKKGPQIPCSQALTEASQPSVERVLQLSQIDS